jgi:hypothetical protein
LKNTADQIHDVRKDGIETIDNAMDMAEDIRKGSQRVTDTTTELVDEIRKEEVNWNFIEHWIV